MRFDFPAPGTATKSFTTGTMSTAHSAAALLWWVAVSALEGRPTSANEVELGAVLCKLPLAAHELLKRLPDIAAAEAAQRLEPLLRGTPAVTRLRRLAMIGAACFPFLVAAMAARGQENLPLWLPISHQLYIAWLMFVAIPSLVVALVFRRSPIMWMFGVDFVTRSGARASRLRMLWRSMICHSPILLPVLAVLSMAVAESLLRSDIPPPAASSSAVISAVVFGSLLLMFAAAMLPPRRGLADRLAGTYPVPA